MMVAAEKKNGSREALWKVVAILAATFASVAVAITGYSVQHLHALEVKMAVIEGNRFTSGDGQRFWQALYKVEREVAACEKKVPEWLLKKVDRLEQQISANNNR